jgi:hypothetical protein
VHDLGFESLTLEVTGGNGGVDRWSWVLGVNGGVVHGHGFESFWGSISEGQETCAIAPAPVKKFKVRGRSRP